MNSNFMGILPIAETKPPVEIPKEEVKYHIATKPYICLCCSENVDKTYHIHSSSSKIKRPIHKKRGMRYC